MKIDVTNLQDIVPIDRPARALLYGGQIRLAHSETHLVFVDDEQMREVNRKYLGRDDTTDVIAFPFEDAPLTTDDCAGEILVSAQRAADEARSRKLDLHAELALYVVHGSLHLAGYDDSTPRQAAEMHHQEKEILAELGYDAARLWKPLKAKQKRSGR